MGLLTSLISSDSIGVVKIANFAVLAAFLFSFVANIAHSSYEEISEHSLSSCATSLIDKKVSTEQVKKVADAPSESNESNSSKEPHQGAHECHHAHIHSLIMSHYDIVFVRRAPALPMPTHAALMDRSIEAPYRPPIA